MLDYNGGEKYFKNYATNGESRTSRFCMVIFEDDVLSLVYDRRKLLKKADFVDKGMYTSGSPYDRFEEKNEYYISTSNGKFLKTTLSSKEMLKVLGLSKDKTIADMLKKEKLTGKFDETEVKLFLSYVSYYIRASKLKD